MPSNQPELTLDQYEGMDMYVVVSESDLYADDQRPKNPIAFETYLKKATFEDAEAFRDRLNGRYGKTRIARLVFVDEEEG